MLIEKSTKFYSISIVLLLQYFDQERRHSLPKIFGPYVRVYGHARTKMILVPPMVEISKNEDRTLITKNHELFNRTLFDFRLRLFPLPVLEKTRCFRFGVGIGSQKYDVAPIQAMLYSP